MTAYLTKLNDEQRQAVETTEGPLLVLAGAGTGKTRVLTTRFAHILLTNLAFPNQVLAVTFTNKAAREMRERVGALLGRPAEGLWLGTFHALCARMLRRHAEHVGLTSSFSILDTDDQTRLLKQVMEALKIDPKRWTPQAVMGVLQRWKDRGQTPDRVPESEEGEFAHGRMREVYAQYQSRLRGLNAADFGDLLLHTTEILRKQPEVLAQYHRAFRYILVDEYQDTNVVQYLWLRLLAQQHKNICCVGDDDQSIYSWRGAEVENILRFEHDFPGARIVRLEQNYRSTAPILAAAAGLIANNAGRLGKTLRSGLADAAGDKVSVVSLWDSDEEARMVGDRVEAWRREGCKLVDMAILVRAGFQTRAFEERMITLAIPYRVVGGLRFYERAEIRDAIAYMRVLRQPSDDLAFERIVNLPRRGVGDVALRAMHASAREQGIALSIAAFQLAQAGALKGRPREAIRELGAGFARWRLMLESDGHVVTIATMLDEIRLHRHVAAGQVDRSAGAPGEPQGTRARDGGFREPFRFPRPCFAGYGERGTGGRRPAQHDDSACREGPRIRQRVFTRLGRRRVSEPAHHGRIRHQRPRGRASPRLCGDHPCAAARGGQPRRKPPYLCQLAEQHSQPVHRGIARGAHGARRFGRAGALRADIGTFGVQQRTADCAAC